MYRVAAIVVHPTCAVSYRVVKRLYRDGLLDKVRLLDARDPRIVLEYRVWSVPWVLVETPLGLVPGATDPVSEDEVAAMVEGGYEPPRDMDVVEAFRDTLVHSSFAGAVALVNDDPGLAVSRELVAAAIRAGFRGDAWDAVERALQRLMSVIGELWRGTRGMVERALGVSFVREYWWVKGGGVKREELVAAVEAGAVRAWLLGKASIGRGGLPWDPRIVAERVEGVERFVVKGAVGLLRKIEREQSEILGDEEYWGLMRERLVA